MNPTQPVAEKPKSDKPKACKKLPRTASLDDLATAHKIKMGAKKIVNDHNSQRYRDTSHIFANLSKNHPNYGETPAEHDRRKNSS